MKPKKARLWIIPLICYGAAIVVYLAVCGIHLLVDTLRLQSGELERRELTTDSLFLDGVKLLENDEGGFDLISENPDPQIIYSPGAPFHASTFTFRASESSRGGGEMTLFYTTGPDEPYTERQRLWAQQHADGSWVFDLGGRQVQALRFDPDTVGGVAWRDWEMVLNEPKPVWRYFLPDARPVFLLLFLPGLAAALVVEARHIVRNYYLRLKSQGKAKRRTKA